MINLLEILNWQPPHIKGDKIPIDFEDTSLNYDGCNNFEIPEIKKKIIKIKKFSTGIKKKTDTDELF